MSRAVLIQAIGNAKLFWTASNATNKITLRLRGEENQSWILKKIGNHFSIININKEGHELFAVTYNQNSELTLEPYNPYVPSPQSQRFYIGNKSGQPHPPLPMAIKSCLDAGHHIVARDGASEDSPLLTKEFEEMQPVWNIHTIENFINKIY